MKTASAVLFASVVAAQYTVYPGNGKDPVVVTEQFQPVATYVNGEWSTYEAISTVFTDAYHNTFTVTNTDQMVTLFHISTIITHEKTIAPTAYGAPTTTILSELYEETILAPYSTIGPHAISGYTGNPKYTGNTDEQYATVTKYYDGTSYTTTTTFSYPHTTQRAPLYVITFSYPGTYTVPSETLTLTTATSLAAATTTPATAFVPITYGGESTSISVAPTTITAEYATVSFPVRRDIPFTNLVIATTTATFSATGEVTYIQPTTTSFSSNTVVSVPTILSFSAGVYDHPQVTLTATVTDDVFTITFTASIGVPTVPVVAPTVPVVAPTVPVVAPTVPVVAPTVPVVEPTVTTPPNPDPSGDLEVPVENFGRAVGGYAKRGGVLRRKAVPKDKSEPKAVHKVYKRIIQV